MEKEISKKTVYIVGQLSSLCTAIIALATFAFALTAIPISGAFCPNNCIEYPYLNTLQQFPNDFIWMYFAIVLSISYLIFMTSIHYYASQKRKIISHIGLLFSLMSALILIVNYFIQVTVVPSSLASGETQGLPLLIQYNSHGLFIALEEIGFLLMSISFLFMSFIFNSKTTIEKLIRWTFISSFFIVLISFIVLSLKFGLDLKDRFEVVIISVNWLVLIFNGILGSLVFGKKIKDIKAESLK